MFFKYFNMTNKRKQQQGKNSITDPRWPPGRRRILQYFSTFSQIFKQCVHSCQRDSSNVFLIIIFFLLVNETKAICPSKCECNDRTLQVSCAYSNLTVVPIQLNPEVKKLHLNNNKIASIHLTLSFYTNLQSLDISYNKIKNIGSRNFEFQKTLKYLNVSHNSLTKLHKDCFKGLKNLKILDLSYNSLDEINGKGFVDLYSLEELHLTHNKLVTIDFKFNNSLKRLKLNENQLLYIPNILYDLELKEIDLSLNLIESIQENVLPITLEILNLQSNIITEISNNSFNNLINLHYLDISDNNFTIVPSFQLSKLINLKFLNLSSNMFSYLRPVSFRGLFKLVDIYLDHLPNLLRIDSRTFIDNINLNLISISNNINLKKLPNRLFKSNFNLKHLRLAGNSFATLHAVDLQIDNIETIKLGNNPYVCNCSLIWLYLLKEKQSTVNVSCSDKICTETLNEPEKLSYFEEYESFPEALTSRDIFPIILDINDVYCVEPKHVPFITLKKKDFNCDFTWFVLLTVSILIIIIFLIIFIVFYITKNKCNNNNKSNVDQYIEASKNYEDINRTYYKTHVFDIVGGEKMSNMYISRPVLKDNFDINYCERNKDDVGSESSGCSLDIVNDVHIYQEPYTGTVLNNQTAPHIVYV